MSGLAALAGLALGAVVCAVKSDPRLAVQVRTEKAYYANIASGVATLFRNAGLGIATLMALAAIIGVINLMHESVAARFDDIAPLRAIGFRRAPVLLGVLCEGIIFGLLGGTIGDLIAYAIFDGYQAGTIFAGATQVDFQLAVSARLIAGGIGIALVMGCIGGLFPAIRAARLPVAKALREA